MDQVGLPQGPYGLFREIARGLLAIARDDALDAARPDAAAIAAVLPNPREYPVNPPSAYMQSRINWILKQMRLFGPLKLKSELK